MISTTPREQPDGSPCISRYNYTSHSLENQKKFSMTRTWTLVDVDNHFACPHIGLKRPLGTIFIHLRDKKHTQRLDLEKRSIIGYETLLLIVNFSSVTFPFIQLSSYNYVVSSDTVESCDLLFQTPLFYEHSFTTRPKTLCFWVVLVRNLRSAIEPVCSQSILPFCLSDVEFHYPTSTSYLHLLR